MNQKYCTKCKTTKETSQFSPNKTRKDKLQTHCKECRSAYNRDWYQENTDLQKERSKISRDRTRPEIRRKIQAYLKEHPCIDCGNNDIEVLEFDHRDASIKEFQIGNAIRRAISWKRIQLEIEKCDIRCANCHRKRTRQQLGWWIDTDSSSDL